MHIFRWCVCASGVHWTQAWMWTHDLHFRGDEHHERTLSIAYAPAYYRTSQLTDKFHSNDQKDFSLSFFYIRSLQIIRFSFLIITSSVFFPTCISPLHLHVRLKKNALARHPIIMHSIFIHPDFGLFIHAQLEHSFSYHHELKKRKDSKFVASLQENVPFFCCCILHTLTSSSHCTHGCIAGCNALESGISQCVAWGVFCIELGMIHFSSKRCEKFTLSKQQRKKKLLACV